MLKEKILDALDIAGAFIKKMGTLIADRRAWVVALFVAVLAIPGLFGMDSATIEYILGHVSGVLDGTVEALLAVGMLIAALSKIVASGGAIIALLLSYAKREPSGIEKFRNR